MFDVDTGAVRHLAAELAERAAQIRDVATGLARCVDDVPWQGAAADAMRTHTDGRLADLLHAAALHDDAGETLTQHAAAVDHTVAVLLSAAETVAETVTDTAGTVVDAAGTVVDTVADQTIGLIR